MPARKSALRTHKLVRRANPKRRARLFAEDFGSSAYVEHLHQYPCAVCDVYGWTVAAHLKSRGAGGKVDDLAPLCGSRFLGTAAAVEGCHELWDDHNSEVRSHSLRLRSMARKLWSDWQTRTEEIA